MKKAKAIQIANQGGYQPAIVTNLTPVMAAGACFMTTENHVDFPNQIICIPEKCVGIVQVYTENPTMGYVSILFEDTITARRLISNARPTYYVLMNEDQLKNFPDLEKLVWGPVFLTDGIRRWPNKIKTCFTDKQEANKFYNYICTLKCGAMRNFIHYG